MPEHPDRPQDRPTQEMLGRDPMRPRCSAGLNNLPSLINGNPSATRTLSE